MRLIPRLKHSVLLAPARGRLRALALVCVTSVAVCVAPAAADSSGSGSQAHAQTPVLRLVLSRGWIGAQITAPAGSTVELSESVSNRLEPLATATTPSSGSLNLPHAARWICARSDRRFALQIVTSPSSPPTYANIQTPSCTRRLTLRRPVRAAVGARIAIVVSDTFGTGGVPYTLCVTPPAVDVSTCHRGALRAGQSTARITVNAESPGEWLLTLRTPAGQRLQRTMTVEHPGGYLRLLATGDSEIQEVDTDLGQGLAAAQVHVTSDARVGTGISKVSLFDWVRHAADQASTLRPDVTVVFVGANDGFALRNPAGTWVPCCNTAWIALFAKRTENMMSSYRRGGRGRVYWFTLPAARDAGHANVFRAVNRAYLIAAAHFASAVHLIRADEIFTPGGRFTPTITYHGHIVSVRSPDGIHLSPAGAQIAAAAAIGAMKHDRLAP